MSAIWIAVVVVLGSLLAWARIVDQEMSALDQRAEIDGGGF